MPQRVKREYAQLLRLHERVLLQLHRITDEMSAPTTRKLLKEIRSRTGEDHDEEMGQVIRLVEEAIRSLKLSESEMQAVFLQESPDLSVDGAPNLPPTLARFLAERKDRPGFSYEVVQDDVRGWIIRWKDRTPDGNVRGAGQFYERPYAWLDD